MQIKKLQGGINDNKNFEFELEQYYIERIDLRGGKGIINTTTCLCCNFTCDKNCSYSDDSQKKNCNVISGEYCTICPGKCHWTKHKNLPYIIEQKKRKVKKTIVRMKELYLDLKNQLKEKQDFLKELKNDFILKIIQYMHLFNKCQIDVEKLKEIALNKRSYEYNTYTYFIDDLISLEEM